MGGLVKYHKVIDLVSEINDSCVTIFDINSPFVNFPQPENFLPFLFIQPLELYSDAVQPLCNIAHLIIDFDF